MKQNKTLNSQAVKPDKPRPSMPYASLLSL